MAKQLESPVEVYRRERDEFQARLWHEAGQAIGKWLEERGKLHQPIRSLTSAELTGMAWSAISKWQDVREAKRLELLMPPASGDPLQVDPLDALLGV